MQVKSNEEQSFRKKDALLLSIHESWIQHKLATQTWIENYFQS